MIHTSILLIGLLMNKILAANPNQTFVFEDHRPNMTVVETAFIFKTLTKTLIDTQSLTETAPYSSIYTNFITTTVNFTNTSVKTNTKTLNTRTFIKSFSCITTTIGSVYSTITHNASVYETSTETVFFTPAVTINDEVTISNTIKTSITETITYTNETSSIIFVCENPINESSLTTDNDYKTSITTDHENKISMFKDYQYFESLTFISNFENHNSANNINNAIVRSTTPTLYNLFVKNYSENNVLSNAEVNTFYSNISNVFSEYQHDKSVEVNKGAAYEELSDIFTSFQSSEMNALLEFQSSQLEHPLFSKANSPPRIETIISTVFSGQVSVLKEILNNQATDFIHYHQLQSQMF